MPTLLERVAIMARARAKAELQFREALVAAHEVHSWHEIAAEAGLSYSGVRYLAAELREAQKEAAT